RLFAIAARSGSVLAFDHFESVIGGANEGDGSGPAEGESRLSDLLERSAGHPGIVIFATRLQGVKDEAVLSHIDHVVEFPFPDRAPREEIWRRELARAGLGELDVSALASDLTLSGGEIAACCAVAKQSGAGPGAPPQIEHIARALEREWATEPLTESRHETLEFLRAQIKSETREWSNRDRPDFEAQAKPTSPPTTTSKPSSRTTGRATAHASAQAARTAEALTAEAPAGQTILANGFARGTSGATEAGISAIGPGFTGRMRFPDRIAARDAISRVRHAPRSVIVGLCGIVVAAALGLLLAASKDESTIPALDRQAAAGPVLVRYPSSWQKRPVPSFPGVALSHAVAFSPTGSRQYLLVLGTTADAGRTILPNRFVAADANPVLGQMVRLGSTWFYRFPDISVGGDPQPQEAVYALPTTAGLVMSVCLDPSGGFTGACEQILGALRLRGGVQPLVTSPEYPRRLSDIITRLNAVRVRAHSELAAARTATGQSRVERRLAQANAQAASLIASLNAGPAQAANAALASALKTTADAYAALARAASEHDEVAYRVASSSLAAAAAATSSAFADLKQLGYHLG
ncbi:MAG: hypothetical protein JO181_01965, partial [Solirubrobacterales bacterium]|nr:hypothetical protein [Solirubrobacterales bacterium]